MRFAFLSYSRKDEEFVKTLEQHLDNSGIRTWRDTRDIGKGSYWDREVEKAIDSSYCMVVILSPDAVASPNVANEYNWALGRKKEVIPVLYKECQVPLGLSRLEYVDFLKNSYETALAELSKTLKSTASAAPDQPAPTESFTEADLSGAAQAIAWECVRTHFWPEPISNAAAAEAVRSEDLDRRARQATRLLPQPSGEPAGDTLQPMSQNRAGKLIDRLASLGFLRRLEGRVEVAKPSNALKTAAYAQVDRHGNERAFWENLIASGRQKLQESKTEEIRGRLVDFLLAMQNAGKARAEDLKISRSLLAELDQVAGRKTGTQVQEYFVNFVRRWGVPEGIARLEESAARQGSSVRITKRNGRVIRLESVNGSGALVPRLGPVAYLGSDSTPPEQAECRWEFSYDESGNVALEEASDAAGRLLYRCAYSPGPPSAEATPGQRQTTARYFIDDSDVVHPRTNSGASFVKITRDAQGFDQRWEYLDGVNRSQPDELRRFGQQAENGPLGLPLRVTCLGADLSPAPCRSGYVLANYTYDEKGLPITQSYFDASGQPVLHAEGYHKATFSWDQHGNWTAVRLFGTQGEPAVVKDGFAGWDAAYDKAGNQTVQTFLDTQNKPAPIKAGYARWDERYDARGKVIEQTFQDALALPTPNADGVVRLAVQFDDLGNVTEVAYRDAAGNPAADYKGLARWTRCYDERGRVKNEFYFGLDGQPARNKEGQTGIQVSYDVKGNQTEFVYLGADGQPDWSNLGYARQTTRYDTRGNAIEERYFAPNGEPAAADDGIHAQVHAYDEHANRISTRFFDVSGKPTAVTGYSFFTQVYDQAGNSVRKEYRDATGRLTYHRDGYAIQLLRYDACGRAIEGRYLDPEEKPVVGTQGFAGWRASYNGRGLTIQRWNFDAGGKPLSTGWIASYDSRGNLLEKRNVNPDGELVLSGRGIAVIRYRYDVRGNRLEEAYSGLKGEPVAVESGLASIAWKHDSRGNIIEQMYLNTARHPVIHTDNYASWTAAYDASGNRVLQQFFGTEGQSVATKDGFVRILTEYDDRGRPCHERKLTSKGEEYSTHTRYDPRSGREERFSSPRRQIVSQYDRAGRNIREAWFQLDGSPEMTREDDIAFSHREAAYDSCGRLIRRTYLDASAAPVRIAEFAYAGAGREVANVLRDRREDHWRITSTEVSAPGSSIEISLVSIDGKRYVSDADGRSRWIEKYDARGNRIEAAYFDADGAPTPYHRHLRTAAAFDDTGRLTKVIYLIPVGGSDTLQRTFASAPGKPPAVRFESTEADGQVHTNEAFVLEYRMNPDDRLRYSTLLNIGDRELRIDMLQRCTAVGADGTLDVAVEVAEPPRTITMTMARSGKVLRTSLDDPPNQPSFPTHPVFVGEIWRQQMPLQLVNPFTGQPWIVQMSYTYELVEVSEQAGRRVARIRTQVPPTVVGIGSEVTVSITADGENTFAVDEGTLLSSRVATRTQYEVMGEKVDTSVKVAVNLEPLTAAADHVQRATS